MQDAGVRDRTQDLVSHDTGWQALANDTGCSVSIIDAAGQFLFVNDVGLRVLGRTSQDQVVGKTLADVFPLEYARQWLALIRRCILEGATIVHFGVLHGRLYRSTVRPVQGGDGQVRAMCVCQPNPADCPDDPTAIFATAARSSGNAVGPLSTLTTRELRVLTLIGEGLRNHEIAARIDRSVRTVDGHVAGLMRKLGVASRTQLVGVAVKAGLARPG